jgi:hypothetical protein
MVNLVSKIAIVGVGFIAIVYQFLFKSIIFDTLGYGRKVLSIKYFNHVKCEKVDELGLVSLISPLILRLHGSQIGAGLSKHISGAPQLPGF